MPRAELDIDEVDDESEPKSINDVSDDAGQKQCQGSEDPVIGPWRSPEEIKYERSRDQRDDRQTPSSGVSVIVEHAECDARVVRICKIQKSRDHRNVVA